MKLIATKRNAWVALMALCFAVLAIPARPKLSDVSEDCAGIRQVAVRISEAAPLGPLLQTARKVEFQSSGALRTARHRAPMDRALTALRKEFVSHAIHPALKEIGNVLVGLGARPLVGPDGVPVLFKQLCSNRTEGD